MVRHPNGWGSRGRRGIRPSEFLLERDSPHAAGLEFIAAVSARGIVALRDLVMVNTAGLIRPGAASHGLAVKLSGSSQYAYGGTITPTIGLPYSVFAWIRPAFSDTASTRHMVINRSGGGYTRFGHNIQYLGDLNQWRCDCTGVGDCSMSDSDAPFTAGQVHHVGFVISAAGAGQGYWDGKAITTSNGGTFSPTMAQFDTFYVGQSGFPSGDERYFSGDIWDARVYRRALSASEVWSLYEPSTRWDLYWTPSTRVYEFFGASAGGGVAPWLYRAHTQTLGAGFQRGAN